MVEIKNRDTTNVISGPTRKPPKDPNSLPEEGVTYETKEEHEKKGKTGKKVDGYTTEVYS